MYKKPTFIEKLAGHPVTEGTMTLIAGAAATTQPIAALLPILTNTLAHSRQQDRLEAAIKEITLKLEHHNEQLQKISDEQYHVLSETISTMFQTINPEKVSYLKSAIVNSLFIKNLIPQESVMLARIIREISAEEVDFIFKNNSFKYVRISDSVNDRVDTLLIPRESRESLIVTGLETIGVLEFGIGTMGDGNSLCFSKLTSKLLDLLCE
ncbi:hypothetical protein [Aeromonas jandaei]|uniref:hypothetical protein n=1 Tax=Aeromonas jandaei TaxID=650 RepID=UPI001ABF5EE2|nr:hypothetical protein [Aeromonas jandaei]QSR73848.1 hypothetical protein GP488_16055 [Aeromonas jandaei]